MLNKRKGDEKILSFGVVNFPFLWVKILIVLMARTMTHMTPLQFIDVIQMISYVINKKNEKLFIEKKAISWARFQGLHVINVNDE